MYEERICEGIERPVPPVAPKRAIEGMFVVVVVVIFEEKWGCIRCGTRNMR